MSPVRESMRTGPYMDNRLFPKIRGLLNMYNHGMPNVNAKKKKKMTNFSQLVLRLL